MILAIIAFYLVTAFALVLIMSEGFALLTNTNVAIAVSWPISLPIIGVTGLGLVAADVVRSAWRRRFPR